MIRTSPIQIRRLATAEDLVPLRAAWNELAGSVVFRSFEWLESWWRCYGAALDNELFTLAACDSTGRLVGLAPWYVQRSAAHRGIIRFLGSGEVCSDYLTVLCAPQFREDVTAALAQWLCPTDGVDRQRPDWELLELAGVDEADQTVTQLVERLAARGNLVHRRRRSSCWRVTLPPRWNDYLAMLSKSHRKQIRRLERTYFNTSRAQLYLAHSADELHRGLELLVRLHQRRRESLGDRGCFASTQFAAFHTETAQRLLVSGNLRLFWLEVDGEVVAVEYQVAGDRAVYAYQSGIEPTALAHQPGRLITIATIKQAIAEGRQAFDFLRGDELYKAHWRAQPRPTQDIRIIRDDFGARLRHHLWLARGNMKSWIKRGLEFSGVTARGLAL